MVGLHRAVLGLHGRVFNQRDQFELNFFAHQSVAQAAVKIMRAQNTYGCLLFNTSKQAGTIHRRIVAARILVSFRIAALLLEEHVARIRSVNRRMA